MSVPYVDHAYRHLPGGTDPLPGAAAPAMWPMSYDLLTLDAISNALDEPAGGSWGHTFDASYLQGFYVDNFASGSYHDAAELIHYVRLGPKGSVWGAVSSFETGTDMGKLKVSFATIPEDVPGFGLELDGEGLITDSSFATATFYQPISGQTYDLYDATPQLPPQNSDLLHTQFRIMGDDGDPLTAHGTGGHTDGWRHMNGGAGIWAVKFTVDGKNASSSDYRITLSTLSLRRWTGNAFVAT